MQVISVEQINPEAEGHREQPKRVAGEFSRAAFRRSSGPKLDRLTPASTSSKASFRIRRQCLDQASRFDHFGAWDPGADETAQTSAVNAMFVKH